MRRMFSKNQIESMAQSISSAVFDEKIVEAVIDYISNVMIDESELSPDATSYVATFTAGGDANVLPITENDAGKVLGVNEDGEPALLPAPTGNKVYKHKLIFSATGKNGVYIFYSSSNTQITEVSELPSIFGVGSYQSKTFTLMSESSSVDLMELTISNFGSPAIELKLIVFADTPAITISTASGVGVSFTDSVDEI